MFQTFDSTTTPEQGPPRVAALRAEIARHGLAAFIVPRADVHQGEYVARCDERLAWLTGFTGSAGFAVVLADEAAVFVDGRYTVQMKAQVDTAAFTPVDWPKIKPGPWLRERLGEEEFVGIDPWLHTRSEIEALEKAGLRVRPVANLVDAIWADRPDPPAGKIAPYPAELAGRTHAEKRTEIAKALSRAGQRSAVLTLPDSISWLLNIRGDDLEHLPVVQALAIIHDDASVDLFCYPAKAADAAAHLGPGIRVLPRGEFETALSRLAGPVRVDPRTAPYAVGLALEAAEIEVSGEDDPCILPKAVKNPAEIAATSEAHLRDGAAMVEFLAWLDDTAPRGGLTEIDIVERLEGFRRATNALRDISFDTIAGSGPNGAIVHYRVTRDSNRTITPGDLLLVDSGGQYLDGTTDITRTVTTGTPDDDQKSAFTRVLQGMIAISRVRWPRGLTGRDLDPLARAPLWMAGQDYDHGTGHGVGVYLSVHEGPQRISRISEIPLEPGMILSNEPGYYREGHWGIRIENLVVVTEAPELGDGRDQLAFDTLTWVPIDTRLVDAALLSAGERDWLNRYHAEVRERIGPRVSDSAGVWLTSATTAI